jgi:L-ascorbate metabolism protein UlaG (beta-lactamase superfamily)
MGAMEPLARVTFLGHSTVLVELGGLRILTDPVLFDRIGPLRRVVSPLDPETHAGIDLALVSHLHLDHFDVPSLRLLGLGVRIVVPAGAGPLLRRLGFTDVVELGPGARVRHGELEIVATEAVHGGFRPPVGPRAAAVGYVIEGAGRRIYFAGDTDLFNGMAELGAIDAALIPVWGWGPRLGPNHLDPERAGEAVGRIRPRLAIPIHWGTLWPFGLGRVRPGKLADPPVEFARLVSAREPDVLVRIIPPGGHVDLPPPRDRPLSVNGAASAGS